MAGWLPGDFDMGDTVLNTLLFADDQAMTQAGLYRAVNKLEKLADCCNRGFRPRKYKPWHFRQKL
jgi:hypothetical protein